MLVQGDVYLVKTRKPATLKKLERTARGIVLAEGEATGHAHTIASLDAVLFEGKNKELYLEAAKEVQLEHQEHTTLTIPSGTYKIGIVREHDYFTEEARKVVD